MASEKSFVDKVVAEFNAKRREIVPKGLEEAYAMLDDIKKGVDKLKEIRNAAKQVGPIVRQTKTHRMRALPIAANPTGKRCIRQAVEIALTELKIAQMQTDQLIYDLADAMKRRQKAFDMLQETLEKD